MLDYLMLGLGLAGISFCEVWKGNGKSFKRWSVDDSANFLGWWQVVLYKSVTLKRFNLGLNAKDQLENWRFLSMPNWKRAKSAIGLQNSLIL